VQKGLFFKGVTDNASLLLVDLLILALC